jgi:hypothetical protein
MAIWWELSETTGGSSAGGSHGKSSGRNCLLSASNQSIARYLPRHVALRCRTGLCLLVPPNHPAVPTNGWAAHCPGLHGHKYNHGRGRPRRGTGSVSHQGITARSRLRAESDDCRLWLAQGRKRHRTVPASHRPSRSQRLHDRATVRPHTGPRGVPPTSGAPGTCMRAQDTPHGRLSPAARCLARHMRLQTAAVADQ